MIISSRLATLRRSVTDPTLLRSLANQVLLVLFCSLCVALPLFAQDEKAKVFKTPQDAYDAFENAEKKKAWKEYCECLTEKSRDVYASSLVQKSISQRKFIGARDQDGYKQVTDVLEKHGLTEDAIKKQTADYAKEKNALKQQRILASPVKDKAALVADLYAAWEKVDPSFAPPLFERSLKDVKVKGDSAQGILNVKVGDKKSPQPFYFQKEKGSWRIELQSVVALEILGKVPEFKVKDKK